jgi:hypothetical protein
MHCGFNPETNVYKPMSNDKASVFRFRGLWKESQQPAV